MYVIVGGGIAAVSCVEAINAYSRADAAPEITVVSASPLVKAVANIEQVAHVAQRFDVEQRPLTWLETTYPNVRVLHAFAKSINHAEKIVACEKFVTDPAGDKSTLPLVVKFDRLCICTGGKPRRLDRLKTFPSIMDEFVATIRDTDSVRSFQRRINLDSLQRVVLVGNGGIATELAYELGSNNFSKNKSVEVIWAVRHASISATFVDAGAAEFMLQTLSRRSTKRVQNAETQQDIITVSKHRMYMLDESDSTLEQTNVALTDTTGSALGPDWLSQHRLINKNADNNHEPEASLRLHVEYKCEVGSLMLPEDLKKAELHAIKPSFSLRYSVSDDGGDSRNNSIQYDNTGTIWPVYVRLTNGHIFGCNFIINATGVEPQHPPAKQQTKTGDNFTDGFDVDKFDGGIIVNERMQSSLSDIYAAGDCCTAGWQHAPHWMQMRLWTQARQMGYYAGRCMVENNNDASISMDFCFEIFTHVTTFFGFKVVLLGLFNAAAQQQQNIDGIGANVLVRIEPGEQYIKVILDKITAVDGAVSKQVIRGAILVGETGMEETLENLILNQTDVSEYGEHLLDPNIDIEDYFD